MIPTPPDRPSIDNLLADLRVLEAEQDYRLPSTGQILATARAARAARQGERTSHPAPGPLHGRTELDQARHELKLAATLILHHPAAGKRLEQLTNEPIFEADDALILACLMHLTNRPQAARFWFKFAAGAESATAASCLYLAHRADAEFTDAEHWRREAARLRRQTPPRSERAHTGAPPRAVAQLRDLLAQCHHGNDPRLSRIVGETIDHLGVTNHYQETPHELPEWTPHPATDLVEALVPCG